MRKRVKNKSTVKGDILYISFPADNVHFHPVVGIQGHPMDLFLKISVLQAHFCWLGDVEEIIVLGRKVLLGKR